MSSEDRVVNVLAAEFTAFNLAIVLNRIADFITEHEIEDIWDVTIEKKSNGGWVGVVYYWGNAVVRYEIATKATDNE